MHAVRGPGAGPRGRGRAAPAASRPAPPRPPGRGGRRGRRAGSGRPARCRGATTATPAGTGTSSPPRVVRRPGRGCRAGSRGREVEAVERDRARTRPPVHAVVVRWSRPRTPSTGGRARSAAGTSRPTRPTWAPDRSSTSSRGGSGSATATRSSDTATSVRVRRRQRDGELLLRLVGLGAVRDQDGQPVRRLVRAALQHGHAARTSRRSRSTRSPGAAGARPAAGWARRRTRRSAPGPTGTPRGRSGRSR